MLISFKNWLLKQEVSTCTGDVAVFARPIGGIIQRKFPGGLLNEKDKKKKKSKK